MCRACRDTPDNLGRRCPRDDGFSGVESDQRNRTRNLNGAADALASGDAQAAVNALEHARRAQRSLDGVPAAPMADPEPTHGPQRDLIVSPSSVDSAKAQLAHVNRTRIANGIPELTFEATRQTMPVEGDPILVWERATIRVAGATQQELDSINLVNVSAEPEKRVNTEAVLFAACAISRVAHNGQYVSRKDGGENSTPALVTKYINDAPDGPFRRQFEPNMDDRYRGRTIRGWIRLTPPTTDYTKAVRSSVAETSMSFRDAGTAASALAGYQRHEQELAASKERTEQALEAARQRASEGGGGWAGLRVPASAPTGRARSRWLNKPGDKIMLTARVERVEPIWHESRTYANMLHIMRSPDGDVVKWIAPGTQGLRPGDELTLRGEVRGHIEFNGEKQTEMTQCHVTLHETEIESGR